MSTHLRNLIKKAAATGQRRTARPMGWNDDLKPHHMVDGEPMTLQAIKKDHPHTAGGR